MTAIVSIVTTKPLLCLLIGINPLNTNSVTSLCCHIIQSPNTARRQSPCLRICQWMCSNLLTILIILPRIICLSAIKDKIMSYPLWLHLDSCCLLNNPPHNAFTTWCALTAMHVGTFPKHRPMISLFSPKPTPSEPAKPLPQEQMLLKDFNTSARKLSHLDGLKDFRRIIRPEILESLSLFYFT